LLRLPALPPGLEVLNLEGSGLQEVSSRFSSNVLFLHVTTVFGEIKGCSPSLVRVTDSNIHTKPNTHSMSAKAGCSHAPMQLLTCCFVFAQCTALTFLCFSCSCASCSLLSCLPCSCRSCQHRCVHWKLSSADPYASCHSLLIQTLQSSIASAATS
jgi:hypothetical protein